MKLNVRGLPLPVKTLLLCTFVLTLADAFSLLYLPIFLHAQHGIKPLFIGFISSVWPLAATIGGFLAGNLSDRIGRKKVLVFSLCLSFISYLGLSMATHHYLLLFFVFLLGFSSSFFVPVSKALMADYVVPQERSTVFSLRYVTINIAYAIGPIIGMAFGFHRGDHRSYLMASIAYFLFLIFLYIIIENKKGIEQKESASFKSAVTILHKDKALLFVLAGCVLSTILHGQWSVPLTQYLNEGFTYPEEKFSILVMMNSLSIIVFQLPVTLWMKNRTPYSSIVVGSLLFALGMVGFGVSNNLFSLILSMMIFSIGEILVISSEYLLVDQLSPDSMRGTYYGAQSLGNIGSFLGPIMGIYFLETRGGFVMYMVFAIVALISIYFYRLGVYINKPNVLKDVGHQNL